MNRKDMNKSVFICLRVYRIKGKEYDFSRIVYEKPRPKNLV